MTFGNFGCGDYRANCSLKNFWSQKTSHNQHRIFSSVPLRSFSYSSYGRTSFCGDHIYHRFFCDLGGEDILTAWLIRAKECLKRIEYDCCRRRFLGTPWVEINARLVHQPWNRSYNQGYDHSGPLYSLSWYMCYRDFWSPSCIQAYDTVGARCDWTRKPRTILTNMNMEFMSAFFKLE